MPFPVITFHLSPLPCSRGRSRMQGQVHAGPWPLPPIPALQGTCPVLLLSLPNALETFPRCTYGITVPALKREQPNLRFNSFPLTSERGIILPTKGQGLGNVVFTDLKVNFVKSFPPCVPSSNSFYPSIPSLGTWKVPGWVWNGKSCRRWSKENSNINRRKIH